MKKKLIFLSLFFLLSCSCENKEENVAPSKSYPSLLWQFKGFKNFHKSVEMLPAYEASDSSLYIGGDHGLMKFNANTGELLWKTLLQDTTSFAQLFSMNTIVDAGRQKVFTTDYDNYWILNSETGEVLHSAPAYRLTTDFKAQTENDFIIDGGRKLSFINKDDYSLENYAVVNEWEQIYQILVDNGIVYFGTNGKSGQDKERAVGAFYALSAESKKTLWSYQRKSYLRYGSTSTWENTGFNDEFVITSTAIIVGSLNGDVISFNKTSGSINWQQKYKTGITPLCLAKGVVLGIAGTDNDGKGVMFALDEESGEEKWRINLAGGIIAIRQSYSYQGYFYHVNFASELTVIEPSTGATIYTYDLPSTIPTFRSINFGQDQVFIHSFDRVYALKAYHTL